MGDFLRIKSWRIELIVLTALAFITRLWQLFTPNSVVFDEVYFKMFSAHYLDGSYFFDIHPPLAKLLLAGFAALTGQNAASLLNTPALGLRVLPAIAGALLVPVVWAILRRLGVSRKLALIGAAAILLDNALLVESRFILMDSMLLLFGISSLYLYLVSRTSKHAWAWLTLAAASAGAAASTKWTGLASVALIGGLWLFDHRREPRSAKKLRDLAILIIVPIVIYIGSFWVHFALLNKTGNGDAFMTQRFQKTLVGGPIYDKSAHMSFAEKFIELNKTMYEANRGLTATHPYGSKWYTWPLEVRPIYYWVGEIGNDGKQGNIYLLGNPIIWWGVLLITITGLVFVRTQKLSLPASTKRGLVITGTAYLINYLPFIGVPRVMFIYHYFFAFVFSIVFATLLWDGITKAASLSSTAKQRTLIIAGVIAIMALGFAFFLPVSYGTPLSVPDFQQRMWLPSWR